MRVPDALRLADTPFDPREFGRLWTVALATYGVGDVVTTVAVLRFSLRVDEMNGLVLVVVDAFGQWGLVALKLVAFLACIAVSVYGARTDDEVLFYLPPAVLAVVGAFATVYNVRLMVG